MTALISFVRNLVINVWLPLSWTREVDYEENDAITKIDEKKKKKGWNILAMTLQLQTDIIKNR